MKLYIVLQNEFFQGDHVGQNCIGVFSSQEVADEIVYELQQEEIFDPMFRIKYDVVPATLDEPLDLE